MAELATVARPYAEALFRVAQTGNMEAWSELVSELSQVGANTDVQAFARNPNVKAEQIATARRADRDPPFWPKGDALESYRVTWRNPESAAKRCGARHSSSHRHRPCWSGR